MSISQKILDAGVVGAGGAGFPTHIKAQSKVEFVIANGAECEPLLHKDFEIMINFSQEIVQGMNLMLQSTSARKGYFGIKGKNAKAIDAISNSIKNTKIEMCQLGDFYPSGDEYELVYSITKKLIPPHGIPLDVGCVVNNVETFYNIYNAMNDIPVTEKFICVTGAVNKPSSFFVPIGTKIKDIIDFAGGVSVKEYGIFVSGIMMGKLTFDLDEVVTKTTAGLIVLPKNHYLIDRMNRPSKSMNSIGKSACDQCSYCTELCPRYLLGYDVQPHKVMRALGFTKSGEEYWNQFASLCSSCGLCTLYSCPENLYPREACDQAKEKMKASNTKYEQKIPVKVHPMKEARKVPLKSLMQRLDLLEYEKQTPFNADKFVTNEVKILLKQHIGTKATPVVKVGEKVEKATLIGDIEEGKLGAKIHASISGSVGEITAEFIVIKK
ncbi:MAG: 4Fe-4S dicluster domain-containing protein [Ignavibacteriales bacterium]|nr:4Fe-4S dicluster domain-containing protein [Ignavibacteriales bacterium]